MTSRTYGQFRELARALELVGERWGLLVVRENCGAAQPTWALQIIETVVQEAVELRGALQRIQRDDRFGMRVGE